MNIVFPQNAKSLIIRDQYPELLEAEILPEFPPNLKFLDCGECKNLKHIVQLPDSLKELMCFNCPNLQTLPKNLPNLSILNCGGCLQVIFPRKLPKNLKVLDCYSCNMKKLPELPHTLKSLFCAGCKQLTSLPKLSSSLTSLNCSKCPISYLPPLPETLEFLFCTECKLQTLPWFPENLKYLICDEAVFLNYIGSLIYSFNKAEDENLDCTETYKRILDQFRIFGIARRFNALSEGAKEEATKGRNTIIKMYEFCLQRHKGEIAPEIGEFLNVDTENSLGNLVSEYVGFNFSKKIKRSRKGEKIKKIKKSK